MNATAPLWVRVGGGLEFVPDHLRHGPADVQYPPPGGPWEPLMLNGRLVGWAERGGLRVARQSAELGQRLAHEQRDYLLGRLGHKLRSSVLALQESARQAAFGRPEMLEGLFEQAQEVGRRAAGLEAAAVEPKDGARGVVLGAVMNLALPAATKDVPPIAQPMGAWWKIRITTHGERTALPVPELGEPLVRLIVDTQLDGWLDASRPDGADIYLPAYRPR